LAGQVKDKTKRTLRLAAEGKTTNIIQLTRE